MTAAGRLPVLALCFAFAGRTAMADTPERASEVLARAARFYEVPGSEVLRDVPLAKVEALRGPRVFDRGPTRMEIRQLEGLHAKEMLVAWFPEQRAALTADVTDYLVEEKRFLQLLDREGLAVETIHAVHSARPTTRAELDADLDFGN